MLSIISPSKVTQEPALRRRSRLLMSSDGFFLRPLEVRVMRASTGFVDALVFSTSWCDATPKTASADKDAASSPNGLQGGSITPVLNPDDKVIILKSFRGHVGLVAVECVVDLGPAPVIEIS